MNILKITIFFLVFSSACVKAGELTPSDIEALRLEFENLSQYRTAPSYSPPSEATLEQFPQRANPKNQFVNLDSVFEENTQNLKRKR